MKHAYLTWLAAAIISGTLQAQNVGVGTAAPLSKATIVGNGSIGAGYVGVAAPANGLIVEGRMGIGTSAPSGTAVLHVDLGASTADGVLVTGTYGAGSTVPNLGAGSRLMFYPGKGAFRAGGVLGAQWDNALVGDYSVALGGSNIASGLSSMALGALTVAAGDYATAMGAITVASGVAATATGFESDAEAYASVAIGRFNVGGGTAAAWVATDPLLEVGIGTGAAARSNALTVLKNGNTGIGTATPDATLDVAGTLQYEHASATTNDVLRSTDALGNADWVDVNTLVNHTLDLAYDGGGAGLGRTVTADAGVVSIQGTDGIEVTGTISSGATIGTPGVGVRMIFNPNKAAMRAGRIVFGTGWDDANVGTYSAAFGVNTIASGAGAFAAGQFNSASGDYATALGSNNSASNTGAAVIGGASTNASGLYSIAGGFFSNASGSVSVALGEFVTASGTYSTALGDATDATGDCATALGSVSLASGEFSTAMNRITVASGEASTAMGYETDAEAYATLAVGRFNVGGGTGTSWVAADPLLEVGIGTSAAARANALTVLKNGNTGIGTATPSATLDVVGTAQYVDGNEADGYVLTSDATGNATWQSGSKFYESGNLNTASYTLNTTWQAIGPAMAIVKDYANTNIEVACDSRIQSGTFAGGCLAVQFEIRIDGNAATYDSQSAITSSGTTDFCSMHAVFTGLASGAHTVQIYGRTTVGTSSTVILDPGGWGGRMLAKETF